MPAVEYKIETAHPGYNICHKEPGISFKKY